MPEIRHHVFAFADIEGSSRLSTPDKEQVQKDLAAMLDTACGQAGIEKAAWGDRGDGYLLVSLTDVPVRDVIASFAVSLDAALATRTVSETRLRVRLIVHQGDILRGDKGWRGPQLDRASRMVDANEVKAALKAAPDGRMAFVVAPELYHSVIRGYKVPDPTAFRMRRLDTKEGSLETWVTITGAAEQPGRDADEESRPNGASIPPGQTINQVGTAENSPVGNTVGGGISYGTGRTGNR
jgi:class 3 adenylate cyclase